MKKTILLVAAITAIAVSALLANAKGVDPGGVTRADVVMTTDGTPAFPVVATEHGMLNPSPTAPPVLLSREVRAGPVSNASSSFGINYFLISLNDGSGACANDSNTAAIGSNDFRAEVMVSSLMTLNGIGNGLNANNGTPEAVGSTDYRAEVTSTGFSM